MSQARNAPCECGSGKKYKHCHGGPNASEKPSAAKTMGTIIAAAIAGLLVWSGLTLFQTVAKGELVPEGAIWSEEHGHWHDANGREIGSASVAIGTRQPLRPPMPGAVWSEEHGHWHDENGQEIPGGSGGGLPVGEPPVPGAVWSAAHNHWHDENGQEIR